MGPPAADILAGCLDAGIAARLADDFSLNGYDTIGTYPSIDELNLLYLKNDVVGGLLVISTGVPRRMTTSLRQSCPSTLAPTSATGRAARAESVRFGLFNHLGSGK